MSAFFICCRPFCKSNHFPKGDKKSVLLQQKYDQMSVSVVIHYLLTINLLTFVSYGHDKWKEENIDPKAAPRKILTRKTRGRKRRRGKRIKHARRRTPEATLMLLAALGGSLGAILAMHIFRHKTRHRKFTIGIPLMLAVQVVLIILFVIC